MITNQVMGIVFANVNDTAMGDLTKMRAIASIPFGARYRLIDFSLSNLVNAGISKIGVITKSNYQSLMDHIGSGKPWDLDRKKSGLFILPPYNNIDSSYTSSRVGALGGVLTFLRRSNEEYVIMCDANLVSNIDIDDILRCHKLNGADITFVYKNGVMPKNDNETMAFTFGENDRITAIRFDESGSENCNFSLNVTVIKRELLIDILKDALAANLKTLSKDMFMPKVNELKMFGYRLNTYSCVIDSTDTYIKANLDLLISDVRKELFCEERPIYTKNRDSMPAKYGIRASVQNCLVGEGAVIKGTVKNSIIFRDVSVESDSVLDNCIIMQGTKIGKNCSLSYVTADKNVTMQDNTTLCGNKSCTVVVPKDSNI